MKVFISSTSEDLREYRAAAAQQILKMGMLPRNMKNFGARPDTPIDVCDAEVDAADVLVGIYGFRYGHIPDDGSVSFTEREFDRALAAGLRCLCYFADPSLDRELGASPEPAAARRAQARFKEKIEQALTRDHFRSPDDLKARMAADLARLGSGEPVGISIQRVLSGWRRYHDRHHGELAKELAHRSLDLVDSPLEAIWSD